MLKKGLGQPWNTLMLQLSLSLRDRQDLVTLQVYCTKETVVSSIAILYFLRVYATEVNSLAV